ncbi:hypothetical protein PLEOSDRAFT_168640 [Pleurotus ostreatus PC15]|uniref:Uncharacterized protein n=1 Tax=Pleurotus ostreatus (strain PC15) TaxID=1137138 RepID=A0A067NGE5_PLEO1|nr:hypothetical protein PLEOSDRAFT_168640 [Pleurotus ostreatus PC15]
MYSTIQKRDHPLEIHPRRRMRASPEGDDSDLTDNSYGPEHATGKAYYYKNESGVEHTTGKGDNTYDSGGDESSEYSDSDGEGDGEGDDSDGDTSASDFDGENSGNGDEEASESTSSVAHPATSSGSPARDLVKTMTTQKPAAVIATTAISLSEKTNEGTEVPASPTAPALPVTATPTKPTKPPSRVSQSSPQRRQGPMRVVSPPSSVKAKLSLIGSERASKASPSAFSKEM